ncbi:putative bifunctional diguanylate cyclase/phosphodiesterase [Kineococcus sp. SYSU DK003]|uniref:putative bifunctional diguanylate cyclase/phosphodiesterase n=1 Tax=Kineococcus sp. SYSU DK003 TaxID=3383124 RepID=UPI003D7CD6B5
MSRTSGAVAIRGVALSFLAVAGVALAVDRAAADLAGPLLGAVLLLTVLAGAALLHRRGGRPHTERGMSPVAWRRFTTAGLVLVLAAVADLVLDLAGGPGRWTGVPLGVGILLGAPLVFAGTVRWNEHCRHVVDAGHALVSACAVLTLAGAGNLLVPHLPRVFDDWSWWRLQLWLLTASALVVLTGTAVVVGVVAGLGNDVRLWYLTGGLAAVSVVDGLVALEHGAGVLAVRTAVAVAVVLLGTAVLRARDPAPALVGPGIPAGGALLVLAAAGAVLLGACLQGGRPAAALVWAVPAVLGSGWGLVGMVAQLSELAQVRALARTDDLTGVANRRHLLDQLVALAGRGQAAALLKVDVDDFGLVNQRLGQLVADRLLRDVAEAVRTAAPQTALVARSAGDTFAVLLPGGDEVLARCVATRVDAAVDALPVPARLGRGLSVSIGLALAPPGALHPEELLHQCGTALAEAKTVHRGMACYDAEFAARGQERARLADDLAAALADPGRAHRELLLHYQPQVQAGGGVVGVEALVRWQHPHLGLLSPDRFLGVAEEQGSMNRLTGHLLARAADEVAGWAVSGRPLRVSVNLSAGSLASGELLPMVDDVLARSGLDPRRLVLEITETTLMADPELAVAVTESLVERGVSLSIDDYGTGYSSLAYLTDLPASELKLDRAFTIRINQPRTADIVAGTVALAHRLGLRVVAEGVEDRETVEVLHALGADETQGYLHSRPLPPDRFERWLEEAERAVVPAE